jgi:uncharacterized membrane protein YjjP (DUF1212 family)
MHAPEDITSTLLMRLARALHTYGSPSHRLEDALNAISEELGVEAQYLVTPTSIVASIGPESSSRMYLSRVEPGDNNLEKLAQLNDVIRKLLVDELNAAEALAEVEAITSAPPRYSAGLTVLAFAVASASAAPLFGGGPNEVVLSGGLGGLIGLLAILAAGSPRLISVYPAMAAFVAAAIPLALLPSLPHFPFIPTLSALIVLVPGLSLTIAINELAHRHLVSGTARLTGAVVTFLQIGLGVAVGSKLATPLAGEASGVVPTPLDWPWLMVALFLAAPAFVVLFRARPTDGGSILVAALLAYGLARFGSDALGPEIGAALGAFGVGSFSNLIARWRHQPAAISLLPGLLLLVPGSVGFRSLNALLENDVLSGIETGFAMVLIAVSLVTGLFLANLVFPSRRLL